MEPDCVYLWFLQTAEEAKTWSYALPGHNQEISPTKLINIKPNWRMIPSKIPMHNLEIRFFEDKAYLFKNRSH